MDLTGNEHTSCDPQTKQLNKISASKKTNNSSNMNMIETQPFSTTLMACLSEQFKIPVTLDKLVFVDFEFLHKLPKSMVVLNTGAVSFDQKYEYSGYKNPVVITKCDVPNRVHMRARKPQWVRNNLPEYRTNENRKFINQHTMGVIRTMENHHHLDYTEGSVHPSVDFIKDVFDSDNIAWSKSQPVYVIWNSKYESMILHALHQRNIKSKPLVLSLKVSKRSNSCLVVDFFWVKYMRKGCSLDMAEYSKQYILRRVIQLAKGSKCSDIRRYRRGKKVSLTNTVKFVNILNGSSQNFEPAQHALNDALALRYVFESVLKSSTETDN